MATKTITTYSPLIPIARTWIADDPHGAHFDLDTDIWTCTAVGGRAVYGATAEECNEMRKCYEIAHEKLERYDSDGERTAAADYEQDMYQDRCGENE